MGEWVARGGERRDGEQRRDGLNCELHAFLQLIVRLSLREPVEEWKSAAAVAEGGNDHQMTVLRHGEILDDHRINCGHGCV